nr:cell surface protein SprA [Geofilum rubicundum]
MRKNFTYKLLVPLFTSLFVMAGAIETVPGVPATGPEWSEQSIDSEQEPEPQEIDPQRVNPPSTGLPSQQQKKTSAIHLQDPDNIDYSAEYDPETGLVAVHRKIGNIPVKLPYTMTLEEYNNELMRTSMQNYWSEQARETSGAEGSGFGRFRVGGEMFESVFGSNVINIRPQGIAELRIGVNTTKIDNPTLQERMRKTTTFDFQQKIQMNIQGTIGERLKLGINYNTEATFDFENQINLEYEGGEDEIIKNIEAGNVSLSLPGTLITGSQSLFGVKTEMQFGKLSIQTVFSQQKGETSVMNIQGGAQTQDFDLAADEYDRNRHFFLSHVFKKNFNRAMENLPVVNSPFNITKVEVWITNRSSDFENSRNIVAFSDLGEGLQDMEKPNTWEGKPNILYPFNKANALYNEMANTNGIRDINQSTTILNDVVVDPGDNNRFTTARDYERIENARLVPASEYTLNTKLGYISLNTQLNADEVLAVAFEYTYNGQVYRVGEFSNAGIEAPQALIMKLIKGTNLSPRMKTWQLMMKNIYAMGAYQVSQEDFRLNVVYMNDSLGSYMNTFTEEGDLNGEQYISIMELDKLNSQQEPYPDGTFDYVPGFTIIPAQGRIIFPILEPFGAHMENKLQNLDPDIREKYVFTELYDSTLTIASQTAEKNKYRLQGSYKSAGGAEISLNAFNIPRGSVIVTAGGLKLTENVDYSVDYTSGSIRILNQGLLESGTPIQVALESQSLFNLQTKTLVGTHLDYRFSEDFNIGGTIMHLRERPLTQKVNFGDEPIANTIWGLNASYFTESNLITSLIDKLPLVETKTPSSVAFEAEFAHLIPGHPSVINKEGTSYIDDFEGTKIPIDMKQRDAWHLASTPQGQSMFPNANLNNDLAYGYNRARLAWYNIDPLFVRNSNLRPDHIRRDKEQLSNHYVREIYEREIFPFKNPAYGEPTNISVLNLAYYPKERGPYNFNPNLNFEGELPEPKNSWGGIMRKIDTNDFESANIDHIEFWVMDPFAYNADTSEGGMLYINLGDISEDILKDSRKFFEQGLPGPGEPFDVDTTAWGFIPKQQSLVTAFSNDAATRMMQDVGLNGMNSETERTFYGQSPSSFLTAIENLHASGNLSDEAYERIMNDPAADDFQYFRGSELDRMEMSILDRYKYYNNPEGNSRPSENSGESYSTAATNIPDGEDINRDNTLSESENYYQFEIPLRPGEMEIGQNYITDIVLAENIDLENDKEGSVKWYQFKIPVHNPDTTIGNIDDLRSVRFMRMFMHDFADTTILRFASLDLIRAEWRRYERELFDIRDNVTPNPNTNFEVSAVNIEENGNREPVNYVLPPGIDRVIDPANPSVRELNEQSISLKVENLARGDARAVYKNIGMDIRQYRRIQMEIHAEAVPGYDLQDGEMVAFIRLGTDYQNNYYEYELPLKLTPHGYYVGSNTSERFAVWPEENSMDIPLELFQQIKLRRNDAMRMADANIQLTDEYRWYDPENPNNRIKIKGNPNLSNVKTLMIGVRNASIDAKTAEIWMNELRLSDFNERGGWAANSRMNIKLADLGSVSVAGRASTIGFGSIDQSVTERSQEDFYQYDVATNLELAKFLGPESRLSIPFYAAISEQVATPEYYPLDPDIPMEKALDNAGTSAQRDSMKKVSQDYTKRKSINFTNVRIQPKDNETPFYAPSNLSATYSYNETYRRSIDTEYLTDKEYRGILSYNFINRPKPVEPFKNLEGSALGLIRDFNFYLALLRWATDGKYNADTGKSN